MAEMRSLGGLLMAALITSLGLRQEDFGDQFANPLSLFRIFHYPPHDAARFGAQSQAVGEHTDYGYLTILRQDGCGGLQVRDVHRRWYATTTTALAATAMYTTLSLSLSLSFLAADFLLASTDSLADL